MQADPSTHKEILKLMNAWTAALASGNTDSVLALYIDDPDATFVGSGPDELRTGRDELVAQVSRDLSQCDKLIVSLNDSLVSAEGGVAWLVAPTSVKVLARGKEIKFGGRLSAVCIKRGRAWRLAQVHFSTPSERHRKGKSYPDESIDYSD